MNYESLTAWIGVDLNGFVLACTERKWAHKEKEKNPSGPGGVRTQYQLLLACTDSGKVELHGLVDPCGLTLVCTWT